VVVVVAVVVVVLVVVVVVVVVVVGIGVYVHQISCLLSASNHIREKGCFLNSKNCRLFLIL